MSRLVNRFTAHYVSALEFARFLSCAHLVLQVIFSVFSSSIFLVYLSQQSANANCIQTSCILKYLKSHPYFLNIDGSVRYRT
jgi:hypothetical protein